MKVGFVLVSMYLSDVLLRAGAESRLDDQPQVGIRSILPTASIGGFNENPFFDRLGNTPGGREPVITGVDSVNISFLSRIGSWGAESGQVLTIKVTYRLSNGSLYTAPKHGESDSNCYSYYGCKNISIELATDEFVDKVDGKTDGGKINMMTIYTRNVKKRERRIYGPLGRTGEKDFSFVGRVVGFFGNSGYNLNGIGALLLPSAKQGPYYGSRGGRMNPGIDFDDNPDSLFSTPVVKVMKVHITYSNDTVFAIQAEYFLLDGETVPGQLHGVDSRGVTSSVSIGDSEVLVGIRGSLSDDGRRVNQVTFVTWKRDGSSGKYGPFGNTTGTRPFASRGYRIFGFSGNAGGSLNGISAYYEQYP